MASHQRGGLGGQHDAATPSTSYSQRPQQQQARAASNTITMAPLPMLDAGGELLRTVGTTSHDWGQALANIEDARAAAEGLRGLIHDAVYLDDEAYTSASHMSVYQQRAQAAAQRIRELENEATALRAEVEGKNALLAGAMARQRETQAQVRELQQELENNAVVFQMHYSELLAKNDEIARLKGVIEGLQQQQQQQQQSPAAS